MFHRSNAQKLFAFYFCREVLSENDVIRILFMCFTFKTGNFVDKLCTCEFV